MAFGHGSNAAVLLAQYDVTAFLNSFDAGSSQEVAETTTFGSDYKTYIVGTQDGTMSLGGFYDGAAGNIDAIIASILSPATAADRPLTVCPQGYGTAGNRAGLTQGPITSYDVSAGVGDAVTVSAELQADGGLFWGILLSALAAVTSTGTNGTGQDNAAATTNGAVANLHVTAFTGTTATIKVQHSTDNTTFTDLITFTAATGITYEQKSVTGTVNRYLRFTISGTFTSVTFTIAVARK